MKTHLPITILSLILALAVSCEQSDEEPARGFVKFYGGYQADAGNDVQVVPGGGYALTGVMNPDSVRRMFLLVTDARGNQLDFSPVFYGGNHETSGNSLLVLDDGYLLTGFLKDTLPGGEVKTDAYIVRTSKTGEEIWSRTYGGDGDDVAFHAVQRRSGGFVVAGAMDNPDQQDPWVFMIDEEGNELGYEFKGNATGADGRARFLLPAGEGYLCGATYDDGAYDGTDFYLIYLDEQCGVYDTRPMGTAYDDHTRCVFRYQDAFALMGYAENLTSGVNELSVYTFGVDQNSIVDLERLATISRSGRDLTGEDCVVRDDGVIAVAGTFEENENRDMMLLFLEDGAESGRVTYGELGNQSVHGIARTPDGGLVMAGTNGLEGNSVISLVKTDAKGAL